MSCTEPVRCKYSASSEQQGQQTPSNFSPGSVSHFHSKNSGTRLITAIELCGYTTHINMLWGSSFLYFFDPEFHSHPEHERARTARGRYVAVSQQASCSLNQQLLLVSHMTASRVQTQFLFIFSKSKRTSELRSHLTFEIHLKRKKKT